MSLNETYLVTKRSTACITLHTSLAKPGRAVLHQQLAAIAAQKRQKRQKRHVESPKETYLTNLCHALHQQLADVRG